MPVVEQVLQKHLFVPFKTLLKAEEALQIDYFTSGFDFSEGQPSSTPLRPAAPTYYNCLSLFLSRFGIFLLDQSKGALHRTSAAII